MTKGVLMSVPSVPSVICGEVCWRFSSGDYGSDGFAHLLMCKATKTYTYNWTSAKSGVYTVDVGVCGNNWATKHSFIQGAATITVK